MKTRIDPITGMPILVEDSVTVVGRGGGVTTPDATDTVKGKLKLTNDLGGTADLPTTPTAVHITGDETADGEKSWNGNQYFNANTYTTGKTYRNGGLAVPGVYLGNFNEYGATVAIYNDVGPRGTYIFQNDDLPSVTAPFYVKHVESGEIIKVVGDSGYTWSGCVRGEFGTAPAPIETGDTFTLQATGDYALYMDSTYERVLVDCTGGVLEVVLPDPLNFTLDDGQTFTIFDIYGTLGNGNALIVRDPSNGNTVEVWDEGAMVTAQYDANLGIYNFQTIKSLPSDYAAPAKYAAKVATTIALAVSSYSFPNLNLSSPVSIEGVTLLPGDPILVKNQATASQNGLYIYNNSTNLTRHPDFQTSQNYVAGLQFYVSEGIVNANSTFILTSVDPVVLDTSSIAFRRSGGVQTISSKTANYTVTAADDGVIISYTALAAARTVTLPALSAVSEGFKVTVADGTSGTHASTNNITVQRAGSDVFVDGSTSKTLNVAGGAMTFIKLNGLWTATELGGTNILTKLQIGTAAGSTTVPDFYGYDTDTGFSFTNNNVISFIAASVARMTLSNASLTLTVPVNGATLTAPTTTVGGNIILREGTTNGTNGVTLKAENNIASDITLTLPSLTDTLIGKTTTDTLTNKTYDTAGTGNSFSINGVAATDNTGTGKVVRDNSPTFTGTVTAPTIVSTGVVRLKNYTVATLPAGTQGDTAFVTDALAPTFLTAVVGGGAVVTPVFYDGTNWVGY